ASGVFWRKPTERLLALVLLCLCLGAWRYTAVVPSNDPAAVQRLLGSGKLTLQGSIADEPRLEQHSTLLVVTVQSVSRDQGNTWQEVHGTISVQILGATFDDAYGPRYGDNIQLAGQLTTPPSYDTPETQASMAFPQLTIESRGGNPLLAALYQFRTTLAGIIAQALPQPFAAILIAIFLSLRTPALKPLLLAFNVTGTAHLIAPSGFKVTLLAGLITSGTHWLIPKRGPLDWQLLPDERRRGNWRRWLRTGIVMLGIVIYTFLSGSGPAALRAGIMGCLLVVAPRLERIYNVYNALALTALLMSLFDPFVLWDTGFQLSFFGTVGIVILTPFFQRLLHFLTRLPLGEQIVEMLAVTLAAQVATLPIFGISFQQISFIAPVANLMTVPLLSLLLSLGALICLSGLLSMQLALICGWLAWPLLWYVTAAITWCAQVPGAYLTVTNLSPLIAWGYYVCLAWLTRFLLSNWPISTSANHNRASPLLSHPIQRMLQCGLALLMLLTTGTMAQITQVNGHLTITFLTSDQQGQGQALLLRTANGQSALFDEGADSSTLAQTLDAQLPFWQRSLNLVVLTDTSSANLAGLQDVISRYTVGQVIDAGMLHPSVAYARWRRTLTERHVAYTQVRLGTSLALDSQVTLQVLWPPAQLHKGSDETHDNALILRLLAPGLRLLLLNSTSFSTYALRMLPGSIAPTYLQAQIVQMSGATSKTFAPALATVLALAHPTLLVLTSIPATKSKRAIPVPTLPTGPWQELDVGKNGPLEMSADGQGWSINAT
ncbi:MAG: ComEC/Rec2 family competence protein, partial [Ktedonobacteraceae bacterium]